MEQIIVNRSEITKLLTQIQAIQARLLILLKTDEQIETLECEIDEPVWASNGTHGGSEVVHTVTR